MRVRTSNIMKLEQQVVSLDLAKRTVAKDRYGSILAVWNDIVLDAKKQSLSLIFIRGESTDGSPRSIKATVRSVCLNVVAYFILLTERNVGKKKERGGQKTVMSCVSNAENNVPGFEWKSLKPMVASVLAAVRRRLSSSLLTTSTEEAVSTTKKLVERTIFYLGSARINIQKVFKSFVTTATWQRAY